MHALEKTVQGLNTVADYRPEYAWCAAEPGAERRVWLLSRDPYGSSTHRAPRKSEKYRNTTAHCYSPGPSASNRAGGTATTWGAITSSRATRADLLWIYREHREKGQWYLHGFFA